MTVLSINNGAHLIIPSQTHTCYTFLSQTTSFMFFIPVFPPKISLSLINIFFCLKLSSTPIPQGLEPTYHEYAREGLKRAGVQICQ